MGRQTNLQSDAEKPVRHDVICKFSNYIGLGCGVRYQKTVLDCVNPSRLHSLSSLHILTTKPTGERGCTTPYPFNKKGKGSVKPIGAEYDAFRMLFNVLLRFLP